MQEQSVAVGDWLGMLAVADAQIERGLEVESYLTRGKAWLWAWASQHDHFFLGWVSGNGNLAKKAFFESPQCYGKFVEIAFSADAYDCPGDYGEGDESEAEAGREPWLRPGYENGRDEGASLLVAIWTGTSLPAFCTAVEAAGGWWLPIRGG